LRAKDPYQDRPLPYVFGTEEWKASSKVGLESSSSESELSDENEDSVSDIDEKHVENKSSKTHSNLGINRLSSTSSESNDYNIENCSTQDTVKNKFQARTQDILNSDTEPTTPSSILPKVKLLILYYEKLMFSFRYNLFLISKNSLLLIFMSGVGYKFYI
jgi:hypothetical protein